MKTNATELRTCVSPLYLRYCGELYPQPGRITIDPRDESIVADYRPEIRGQPMAEYCGLVLTIPCDPCAAGYALADWLEAEETQALAQRAIDGHHVSWDGHNHTGSFNDDAQSALFALDESAQGIATLAVWDAADWYASVTYWSADHTSVRIDEHRITAKTTDDELDDIETALDADDADDDMAIIPRSLWAYLSDLRDNCRDDNDDE